MKNQFIIWVGIAVAIVLALSGLVGDNQSVSNLSGMTNYDGVTIIPAETGDGLIVGPNGSTNTEIKSTTCNLSTTQLPLEATSTDIFQCGITGVASGDQVFVTLPSSNLGGTDLTVGSFVVSYATASSTAGFIEVGIMNLSGAATSTFPTATTSVQVLYLDS